MDDDIEVVEVVMRPRVPHFIFSNAIKDQERPFQLGERTDLFNKIKTLKGFSTGGIFYDKEATHCIAPNTGGSCNLAVLGCVASRKKLVNALYIRESFEAGRFLDETETRFIPEFARGVCNNQSSQDGKTDGLFKDIKCVVFLSDNVKAGTYKSALEDGGAVVCNWSIQQLNARDPGQIRDDIEYIFTEPACIDSPEGRELAIFRDKQTATQQTNPVLILSYFFLYAKVFYPDGSERWKQEYDISNETLMTRLHRKNTLKKQPQAGERFEQAVSPWQAGVHWPFRRSGDADRLPTPVRWPFPRSRDADRLPTPEEIGYLTLGGQSSEAVARAMGVQLGDEVVELSDEEPQEQEEEPLIPLGRGLGRTQRLANDPQERH